MLHEAFQPKAWLLSAAVSPSRRVIDSGYDVPALSRYLDWIAVMCYDYHGQWDKITGHVAPMYVHPEDIDVTFNAVSTLAGLPPELPDVPFFLEFHNSLLDRKRRRQKKAGDGNADVWTIL